VTLRVGSGFTSERNNQMEPVNRGWGWMAVFMSLALVVAYLAIKDGTIAKDPCEEAWISMFPRFYLKTQEKTKYWESFLDDLISATGSATKLRKFLHKLVKKSPTEDCLALLLTKREQKRGGEQEENGILETLLDDSIAKTRRELKKLGDLDIIFTEKDLQEKNDDSSDDLD
jgi:hypothetical protein